MKLPTLEKETVAIEYPAYVSLGDAMYAFMMHLNDRGLEPIPGSVTIELVANRNMMKDSEMYSKRRISASTVKRSK